LRFIFAIINYLLLTKNLLFQSPTDEDCTDENTEGKSKGK